MFPERFSSFRQHKQHLPSYCAFAIPTSAMTVSVAHSSTKHLPCDTLQDPGWCLLGRRDVHPSNDGRQQNDMFVVS